MVESDFDQLLDPNESIILGGDLNCKHPKWNSKSTNTNGRNLDHYTNRKTLIITGPDDDTHICTASNTTDTLDIAIFKYMKWTHNLQAIRTLSSDHLPVIIDLHTTLVEKEILTTKINWSRFKNLFIAEETTINTPEDIENHIQDLERRIVDAMDKATTKHTVKSSYSLPIYIKELLKEKIEQTRNIKEHSTLTTRRN